MWKGMLLIPLSVIAILGTVALRPAQPTPTPRIARVGVSEPAAPEAPLAIAEDSSPFARAASAFELTDSPSPSVVDELAARLESESDPEVQEAIVTALGRLDDPLAARTLLGVLNDPTRTHLWFEAARSLGGAPVDLLPEMERRWEELRSAPEHAATADALRTSIQVMRHGFPLRPCGEP